MRGFHGAWYKMSLYHKFYWLGKFQRSIFSFLWFCNTLTLFTPMSYFYTPWKSQKKKGFLTRLFFSIQNKDVPIKEFDIIDNICFLSYYFSLNLIFHLCKNVEKVWATRKEQFIQSEFATSQPVWDTNLDSCPKLMKNKKP